VVSGPKPRARGAQRLVVDPIACDGYGICAELLPELIALDDWGFPMVAKGPVPPSLRAHARRAVRDCPKLALRLEELSAGVRQRPAGRPARA